MKTKFLKTIIISISGIIVVIIATYCKKDSKDTQPNPVSADTIAWVVGGIDTSDYGMILYTEDGGISWERQGAAENVFKDVSVTDLYILDKNKVWVVCDDYRIARTNDGGNTWEQVNCPSGNPLGGLLCISIVDKTNIWISGSYGYVANSTDDGNTWTLFDTAIFNSILCQGICAINSQVVYVVANDVSKNETGLIRRTLDGGNTWDSVDLDDDFDAKCGWIGVTATDADHVIVYAGLGYYAYTTDGGTTWINDSMHVGGGGNFADINHLIMLDDDTWWAALDLDHIIFTDDAGATWTEQQSAGAGNQFLFGIDAYDRDLALITGISASLPWGKIIRTCNGGTTWTSVYEGNSNLNKVSFVPK